MKCSRAEKGHQSSPLERWLRENVESGLQGSEAEGPVRRFKAVKEVPR